MEKMIRTTSNVNLFVFPTLLFYLYLNFDKSERDSIFISSGFLLFHVENVNNTVSAILKQNLGNLQDSSKYFNNY